MRTEYPHRWIIAGIGAAGGGIVIIFAGYFFKWTWTGFFNKTLWDWMQLLIIPVVLAVGGLVYNRLRDQTDHQIASDNQQEAALQGYLDRISELLLKEHLRESEPNAEVRSVARARTFNVLRGLDAVRRRSILRFLYESGLIRTDIKNGILDLSGLSLYKLSLHADMRSIDLSGVNLRKTNLSGANLCGADLSKTVLEEANLSEADLSEANLSDANLSKAILHRTNLHGANLKGALLGEANLDGADLREAIILPEQLEKAQSYKNVII